jgi:hypothetical protein
MKAIAADQGAVSENPLSQIWGERSAEFGTDSEAAAPTTWMEMIDKDETTKLHERTGAFVTA